MNVLLIISICLSILAQMDIASFIRPCMYGAWGITCLCLLPIKTFKISRFTGYFLLIYMVYIVYCLVCTGILGLPHIKGTFLQLLFIPVMLCILGDAYAPYLTEKSFQKLLIAYLLSSLGFAIYIHLTYFSSYSAWRSSMMYDFVQKNSAAQIWGTALLINLFLINYKKAFMKYLGICIMGYFMLLIFASHCRTALLGLICVFLWNVIKYSKYKFLWIGAVIVSILSYLFIPSLQDALNHSLLLTKYDGTDMDAFSSGRLGFYHLAWDTFLSSPLLGIGEYYVDNSYLCILAQSGIIGFGLIESIWLFKIFQLNRLNIAGRLWLAGF